MVLRSRRELLKDSLRISGGLAIFGVAACGGDDEPTPTTAATTAATAAPTTAAATTAAPTTMGKEAVTIDPDQG